MRNLAHEIVERFGPHGGPILRWVGFAAVFAFSVAGTALLSTFLQILL